MPAKRIELRASTHRSYVHKAQRHILPTLGRKRLRRLRPEDLERLYESMLRPTDGTRPLSPKTVYEVHLIIRGALDHALRRGLVTRNVALTASAPQAESDPKGRAEGLDRHGAPGLPACRRWAPAVSCPVALRQHRHAPQRTARRALDGPRPRPRPPVDQPWARRGRLRDPRNPWKDGPPD
ncbi:MAG: hypothetical protein IPG97_08555 [Microthrixaceae bacterium]|nr:hypothetical protein [Microthrixaceae bacterium]